MKRKYLVFTIVLLLISFNVSGIFVKESKEVSTIIFDGDLQNCTKKSDQHSYHLTLSGSRIWAAVKFNFSEHTVLERHSEFSYSMNDSSTNFIAEFFYGMGGGYMWTVLWSKISIPDRYFQYKIGPFYGYRSHTKNNFKYWGNGDTGTFGISMLANEPQYYIFMSYMNSSTYDIWLNWTGNATVSVTQGIDVFAYDRHDFTGTINIGRRRRTFILNGQKEIDVENTLFAFYDVTNVSNGRETLEYTTPSGDNEYLRLIDKRGEHIDWNRSMHFSHNLIWGESGTWKFSVNMFNRGLIRHTPNFYLVGADVRIPD